MPRTKSTEPAPLKVTVSLPPELVKAIDDHAAAERRSRSNAVRALLEDALAAVGRRTAS
jgi:metal-responsive CopG/Arc/MetJ family transcriptional regulator